MKRLVEVLVRQAPRDVHQRPRAEVGVSPVEALAVVDRGVEQPRLLAVAGVLRLEPAHLLQEPAGHEHRDVDREHRRRVVHRSVLGERPIVEHRRHAVGHLRQDVVPHDRDRDARRAEVLLRAGVDHAVAGHVDRPGQEVRRHVGHQRHVADGRGVGRELHALDRLVRRDVGVRGAGGERLGELGVHGHPAEAVGLTRPSDADGSGRCRFLRRLRSPRPRDHQVGRPVFAVGEVEGHHRELLRGSALAEQDLVRRRDRQQRAQVRLGFGDHAFEPRAAMRELQRRGPHAGQREQISPDLLEHRLRQDGRPGGEVDDAIAHDRARLSTRAVSVGDTLAITHRA